MEDRTLDTAPIHSAAMENTKEAGLKDSISPIFSRNNGAQQLYPVCQFMQQSNCYVVFTAS